MNQTLRPARAGDLDGLLALMRSLYDEDGDRPFDEEGHRGAAERLIASPDAGRIFVLDTGDGLVGYAVVTWGFSLEYRGRDAFLDELYVAASHRGQGLAGHALAAVEAACLDHGVNALHLEVERENVGAQRLYRRLGFADHDRYLLTKWLGGGEALAADLQPRPVSR